MSKLEEQKALPRRRLFREMQALAPQVDGIKPKRKAKMLRPEPIIEALAAGTIALPNRKQLQAYVKRKAKKAKRKP